MYKIYERLLKAKGLTTKYVCEKTGIAKTTIWRWKKGETELNVSTLKKIADVLEVPLLSFFVEEGSKE